MYYLTYRPRTIEEIDNVAPRETIKKYSKVNPYPMHFCLWDKKEQGKLQPPAS